MSSKPAIFIIVPIGASILLGYTDLALTIIGIVAFQFLQVGIVYIDNSIRVGDHRMSAQMLVEYQGLPIVAGKAVAVEWIIVPYPSGKIIATRKLVRT